MKKLKVLLTVLLVAALLVPGNALAFNDVDAKAASGSCEYLSGDNTGDQNYTRAAQPVYSYLVATDTGFMRVQGNAYDDGISVSYYDSEYNLLERKKIPSELALFGGFFTDGSDNYIVTGQTNPDEDNNLEVYRITKYDKSWTRIGSCGLYGANTTIPFRAGSCRMDMDGKYLIVRTSHQMYKSSDGLNHQANVTIEVDTSDMKVTDSFTKVMNSGVGYVSHSFNQFVKIENHSIVSVDHGDAYPRSICFMKYSSDLTGGTFQGSVKCINVLDIPGSIGNNTTGASVGGFEIGDGSYVIAGNSVVQDENNTGRSTRNIFVATVDKSSYAVNIKWLTDFEEGEASASTPQLVKLSGNSFMVLWYRNEKVYYAVIDGSAGFSEILSLDGKLSDCVPIFKDGKVIWYTWEDGIEKFYEIPVGSTSAPAVKTVSFEHEYSRVSNANEYVTLKCDKCGKTISGMAVSDFTMFWKKSQAAGSYWSYVPSDIQKDDEIVFLYNLASGYSTDEPEFSEMVIESDDPEHCKVSWKEGKVTFTTGGVYYVRVYPKYYIEAAETYKFTVNPLPNSSTTPTVTAAPTATAEPTVTASPSPTAEPTATASPTAEPTATAAPTATAEPTVTVSPSPSPTNYPTSTPAPVPTNTVVPTPEPTSTPMPTPEPTTTVAPTPELTTTAAPTPEPTTIAPTVTPVSETIVKTSTTTSNGTSTETKYIYDNGKVSVEINKTFDDGNIEKSRYSGTDSNEVQLDSYSVSKKTVTIPKYIKANGKKYYITSIGKNVLGYNELVKTVKIGSNVTSIQKNAFKYESSIKKIEIYADSLESVGKGAFKGIYKKAKITLIGTEEECERAKALIVASGIGKKVKIVFKIVE